MPSPEGFPATREEFSNLPDVKNTPCWEAWIAPRTLDEIEWRMTMRYAHSLPWLLEGFHKARTEIDDLLSKGYVEVGLFNGSPIGGMVEGMTPLRTAVSGMAAGSYRIVDYFYDDDDRHCHVFVHGMRGEQMRDEQERAKSEWNERTRSRVGRPTL